MNEDEHTLFRNHISFRREEEEENLICPYGTNMSKYYSFFLPSEILMRN